MNPITPFQSSLNSNSVSRTQTEATHTDKQTKERVKQITDVEFVPADLNDLEFQAQQQAEENDKRRGQSRESNAFLQAQDDSLDATLGRFINIEV